MLDAYREHLKQLNKRLIREGIILPIDLDVDTTNLEDQVTIMESFLQFNEILKASDSRYKLQNLLNFTEQSVNDWLRDKAFEEYSVIWTKQLSALKQTPENAGIIEKPVNFLSMNEITNFTESLDLLGESEGYVPSLLEEEESSSGNGFLQFSSASAYASLEFDDDVVNGVDSEEVDEDEDAFDEYEDDSSEEESEGIESEDDDYYDGYELPNSEDSENLENDSSSDLNSFSSGVVNDEADENKLGDGENTVDFSDDEEEDDFDSYSEEDTSETSESEVDDEDDFDGYDISDEDLEGLEDEFEEEDDDFDSYEETESEESEEDDDFDYYDTEGADDSEEAEEDDFDLYDEEETSEESENEVDDDDYDSYDSVEDPDPLGSVENDFDEDDFDDYDEYSDESIKKSEQLPYGVPSSKPLVQPTNRTNTNSNMKNTSQPATRVFVEEKVADELVTGVNKGLNALFKKFGK